MEQMILIINEELERIANTTKDYAKEHREEAIINYQESIVERIGGERQYSNAIEGYFQKIENTKDGEEVLFSEEEEMIANHLLILPKGDTYNDGKKSANEVKNTIKEYGLKYIDNFAIYNDDGTVIIKGGSIHSLEYQKGYYEGLLQILNEFNNE